MPANVMTKKHFFQPPTHVTTNQETNWDMTSETVLWTTKEQYQVNTEIKLLQEIARNWETFLVFGEIFERLFWGHVPDKAVQF